jgi:CheY-like chemotaxis protein
VADDVAVNIEVLKNNLTELGVIESCTFCYDGQETIDKI